MHLKQRLSLTVNTIKPFFILNQHNSYTMYSPKKIFNAALLTLSVLFFVNQLSAQEIDLFKMQEAQDKKESKEKTDIVTATFKTTRLINGQSIENVGRGILDVKISHRFGPLNSGAYNLFGLDNASTRFGVDYGITDRLMVGVGRSSNEKLFDGFMKYRILRQSTGKRYMPFSVSYSGSINLNTLKDLNNPKKWYSDRLTFSHQLIIASKLNDYISIQFMPTFIHYNSVPLVINPNDLYAVGGGLRLRISKRVNLTGEYYYQITQFDGTTNALSLGIDLETGGHVFQFVFSNSLGMTDRALIAETTGSWKNGDIHFGFNIARVFTIKKKKAIKL